MTAGRRDQLASALMDAPCTPQMTSHDAVMFAETLMPTVDRMIRQAQAEALESAATFDYVEVALSGADYVNGELLDRAAALRLTTDRPDVTQDAP